jgi:uncharacterized protein YjbI with pentapeptide repeats
MANQEHLDILKQGVEVWNQWRKENAALVPDLSGANLSFADLVRADLRGADLSGADLSGADLSFADLRADLRGADLSGADLVRAELSEADLSGANLAGAILVGTNLKNASLTNCSIYGISAWDVQVEGARQDSLVITLPDQPIITVDNLKVAQFVYVWLNNEEIREVIDTVAKKAVLILGRFPTERKAIADTLRDALRQHSYSPIMFDLEKPASPSWTETTLRALARLARFIIADLTGFSDLPKELQAIVPTLVVPVQSLLLAGKEEAALAGDLIKTHHWVLPVYVYKDQTSLQASLKEYILEPVEQTGSTPLFALTQLE